jgi:hypothetical protein
MEREMPVTPQTLAMLYTPKSKYAPILLLYEVVRLVDTEIRRI